MVGTFTGGCGGYVVGGGGWLEKLGIRLSQLPTKLKLKLKLSLAIYCIDISNYFNQYCGKPLILIGQLLINKFM